MILNTSQRLTAPVAARLLIAIAAVLALSLTFVVGEASAITKRPLLYQFGKDGTTPATFEETGDVAFDEGLKRLYVLDRGFSPATRKIYAFKVTTPGNFEPIAGNFPLSVEELGGESDIAVDSSSHNLYYSSESTNRIYGFDQNGSPLGGNFPIVPAGNKDICGLATDPAGNIWAGDYSQQKLRKFSPTGVALPAEDVSVASGRPCHLDFDSNGDMYVALYNGPVRKITAASGYTADSLYDSEELSRAVSVDRTTHRVFVAHLFSLKEFNADGTLFREFGTYEDTFGTEGGPYFFGLDVNEETEEVFVGNDQSPRKVLVFGPRAILPDITTEAATATTRTTATVSGKVDLAGGPEIVECFIQYGAGFGLQEESGTAPCSPSTPYLSGTTNVAAVISPLKAETTYSYRVVARSANGTNVGAIQRVTTDKSVKDVTTLPASEIGLTTATLNGSLDPDGIPGGTTYYFQYGQQGSGFPSTAPAGSPPGLPAGEAPGTFVAHLPVSGLVPGKTYNFRLVGVNIIGTTVGETQSFIASSPPSITDDYAERVNTDGAVLRAKVSPDGFKTDYHFEYGPEDCEVSTCEQSPVGEVGTAQNTLAEVVSFQWSGLEPGHTYHFRIVASNSRGMTTGVDRVFTTYQPDSGIDECKNVQARQQSGSTLLLDCRGYELVSAPSTGGFDVVSDLVFGQVPLTAYPRAGDSALYSLDSGVIPGIAGDPTNLGRDPYVATRNEVTGNWITRYVGLPSQEMADPGAFGSPLLGADASLRDFAFGGKDICDPCFSDGSTNIPLRLSDGTAAEGMTGPVEPPAGERNPSGVVRKYLSDNGAHLIFGASKPFHPDGNSGSVSIYDRNLTAGTTQVASTLPDGSTMGGTVSELDASADGERIVVATRVSTDAAGNEYVHPYMHIGNSKSSVDLAPTSTSGVLYAGMSSDGSRVFFTSKDKLASDSDDGADLYQATVGPGGGPAVITRLSVGSSASDGDTNACNPVANSDGNNWNEVGGASADNCGVVAIAGGGGVASGNGTIYFLSPEALDGSGTLNQPNLFVVRPGSAPKFVATLEPNNSAVRNAVKDNDVHRYGDFQVNIDGRYAAFNSALSLTAVPSFGQSQIYRYDADTAALDCASCAPTLAAPTTDTTLSPYGLSLTDDGRVFFTTQESLALRDTNERKDAYEWESGTTQLISMGIGPYDSGMLSVSADGLNAFFFTRDTLVHKDTNGTRIKLYDAREGGGFVYTPPPLPCAASDECHGAGTEEPGPPNIKTQTGTDTAQPARRNCQDLSKGANQESNRAKQARRKAAKAVTASARRSLLKQAKKYEEKAKKLAEQATACPLQSGGNG